MANLPNLFFVPNVVLTTKEPSETISVPNAVARYRKIIPTPFNAAPTTAPE